MHISLRIHIHINLPINIYTCTYTFKYLHISNDADTSNTLMNTHDHLQPVKHTSSATKGSKDLPGCCTINVTPHSG